MNPDIAIAYAEKAASLNALYVAFALVILAGVFSFVAALGERVSGFDLKRFVNNVEQAADDGKVWPGIVAFIVVPGCLLGLVLFIGLR